LSWLEGLDMFRLGATIATGRRMIPLSDLSFVKRIFVDGCLRVECRIRIAFNEGLCNLGEESFV
jgi:hypothetical protein